MSTFKTDKITVQGFYPHYLRIAADLGASARVCEIGVDQGESLRMWQALFPLGDVAGVDINAGATWPEGTTRIEARQDDPALPGMVGPRELIVDDASHLGGPTTATFNLLWPCVTPGGYYVIEDWWDHWGMKDSMLPVVQNLLPLLRAPEYEEITYRWGMAVVRKGTGGPA